MGRHQAERHTRLEIGPTLKWVAKRPKLRSDYKWPKSFMGRQQAERHTGPEISPTLKWVARKMYILKIGPSLEWAVNRPKSHRADIEPKYIAGC